MRISGWSSGVCASDRGANRVQTGARARALENQVFVAVSPTVGLAEWSPAVDVSVGWASVLAPPDRGMPDDGVIAQGALSQPGWVNGELGVGALAQGTDARLGGKREVRKGECGG